MNKYILVIVAVVIVILAGGTFFLMTWNIPAPSERIVKVIPDARFPH